MIEAIQVEGLSRVYGALRAVDRLTFAVPAGQVVGFVGANGAGKTTTMRIMATLESPSEGSARICGYDVVNFPRDVRRLIGWMPDAFGRYPRMTVTEYLDFFCRAFGYRGTDRTRRIRDVMEFTDLDRIADRETTHLSKGMGQRLCLGRALLNDPEVLILDEPAAGLDPTARIELIRLIRLLAADGKTVFISSHILSELGEMCDSLLFIDQGRLVHHGPIDSYTHDVPHGVVLRVRLLESPEQLREWALMNPGVEWLEEVKDGGRLLLRSTDPRDHAGALRRMMQAGLTITEFHREKRRLEEAFVRMIAAGAPPPLPDPPAEETAASGTRS